MIWQIDIPIADIYTIDSLDSLIDHEGYLYCVSDSNDSFPELVDEECKLRERGILCVHAGSYLFDKRVVDLVLGLDILKDVIFLNSPAERKMYFFESEADYKEYIQIIV